MESIELPIEMMGAESVLVAGMVTLVPATSDRGTFTYAYVYEGKGFTHGIWSIAHKRLGTSSLARKSRLWCLRKILKNAFLKKLYL